MNNLTKQFIKDLYKNFPNTQIYRLDDTKKGGAGAYPISHKEIDNFNNINKKNGIFFTPNGDFKLVNGKRTQDNAKNLYCFFVDRDDKYEFRKDFHLQPTIIVETKQGFHCYWLFKTHYPIVDFGNKWKKIQENLIERLGGDPQVKDFSRIMRFPSSVYRKDNEGKKIIEVIEYNPDNKYIIEDFDSVEKKPNKIESSKKNILKSINKDSRYLVEDIDNNVDVGEVLEDLGGGTREIKGTYIYEGGKITRGYKKHPTDNYIINWSTPNIEKDRPEGGPFAVAKQLLQNKSKTFKYFKEKYNIGNDIDTVSESKVIEKGKKLEEGEKKTVIESPIGEIEFDYDNKKTRLYRQDGSNIEIMDGVLERKGYFIDELGVCNYIVKYYKIGGEGGLLVGRELGKVSEFDKWISQVGLTFFGGKAAKQQIISYIQGVTEKYEYINSLGIYGKNLIVSHTGQYTMSINGKKYFVDIKDNNRGIEKGREVITIPDEKIDYNRLRKNIQKLQNSYASHIISSLFTSFALSIFSYYVRKQFRFVPLVGLVGLTQSGKTTNRRLMNKMFGIDTGMFEIQASATEFVVMSLVNHYVPLGIGEYQNDLLRFDWDTFLKNNFDNTQNLRGTPNQAMKRYENNGILFIDGETRSLNNAVYSRSIMLHFNPKYRKKEVKEMDNVLGYFIENYEKIFGLRKKFEEIKNTLQKKYNYIEKHEKDRIIDNYSLLIAFSSCFGFNDLVKEPIEKQLEEQFKMMGEDNVDKIIKTVVRLATMNEMPVDVVLRKDIYLLKIEFQADILRINNKKLADIQSSILLINNHFFPDEEAPDDILFIPVYYTIKNKNLHIYLNNILNHLVRTKNGDFPEQFCKMISDYARSNGYRNSSYLNVLEDGMLQS